MKSVLRMSDQELAHDESPGLLLTPAAGVSLAATGLALAAMRLRYTPGDTTPISGIDTLDGQLTIATGLGLVMFASAWLVRGIMMRRLQWAVLLSLAIHLVICIAMHILTVEVPLVAAAEINSAEAVLEELTLPDYGGVESIHSPAQEWERPTDIRVPQTQQQRLERQQAEPEIQPDQQEPELHRQVRDAAIPERRQSEPEQLEQPRELKFDRQQRELKPERTEMVESPDVTTQAVQPTELTARELQQTREVLHDQRQEQQTLQSQSTSPLTAARAERAEIAPQELQRVDMERLRRDLAAARSDAAAAPVSVTQAQAVARRRLEAQSTQIQRRQDDSLTQRQLSPLSLQRALPVTASGAASARTSRDVSTPAAPSGGGAAAIQRASRQSPGSAGTSAESVSVAAATGAAAPVLQTNAAASGLARGAAAVPRTAAGGGGVPSFRSSREGAPALPASTLGRGSGTGVGAGLGQTIVGGSTGAGRSPSRQHMVSEAAAGMSTGDVRVSTAGAAGGSSQNLRQTGPAVAAGSTSRGSGQLSVDRGSGSVAGPSWRGDATNLSVGGTRGRDGLAGRNASADAHGNGIGHAIGTTGSRTSSAGRRFSVAALSDSALRAEQSGELVISGPQGVPSGGRSPRRGVIGPANTSTGRRSAGLPGSGPTQPSLARRSPGLPGTPRPRGIQGRAVSFSSSPTVGTKTDVAAFIRRTVPGIGAIPGDRISAGFSMRTPESRAEAVRQFGGNDVSEAAVERGLEWLAQHQFAAGNWSIHDMNCRDHDCGQHGIYQADAAATGLALLAFQGAGHTHQTGDYQQVVQRGLQWLLAQQKVDGDLFNSSQEFAWFYSHGIASIALCEAYGMTKDDRLQEPAQRALDFIARSQHRQLGGWRYLPEFESDTSVSGWQLMALKSGQMAGLRVEPVTFSGVQRWLTLVEDPKAIGRFRYHPSKPVTTSMTAEGLLMRQYLGADRTDDSLIAGARSLLQRPPRSNARDAYYWYYATQVMFHMQGEYWETWNAHLRDLLVESQSRSGPTRGSWDALEPDRDKWGGSGGRHYITCLNLLMLEVYYRHLPLYIDL